MRVGNLRASRPDWYDRSPQAGATYYQALNAAGFGPVQVLSYTTPSQTLAQFGSIYAHVIRRAAVAGGQESWIQWTYASQIILTARVFGATIGDTDSMVVGGGMVLEPGVTIVASAYDGGGAGRADYTCGAFYTQFARAGPF